jgi:hypothetical protein
LLHFFEATTEFLSIILLSAFSTKQEYFEPHNEALLKTAEKYKLSFSRATFGTWKLVVEYLGKELRRQLSGDTSARSVCSDMFACPSFELQEMLSSIKLLNIISTTNHMRNNWGGHTGFVSPEESRLRHEQLVSKLQELREAMPVVWSQTQLIKSNYCKPKSGVFENEVAILMGSNSEFLKEKRQLSEFLDVDRIYLATKGCTRALKLLPLVEISSSPQSAKNACDFFNRTERNGIRFITYHFSEISERIEQIVDMNGAMRLFMEGI